MAGETAPADCETPDWEAPDWQAVVGHRFADPELLRRALTHRSASRGTHGSNERLEFLGDRVLGLAVAHWLIERHGGESEGDLGKRLAALVARPTLAAIGQRLGLDRQLIVPDAEARAGVRARATVVADALEAVIGALYLDGGLPAAAGFVRRHWADRVEAMQRPPMAAKTRLQEWLAARARPAPRYRLAEATGPAHAPFFTIAVESDGIEAEAQGRTKRAAEEQAAALLLAKLEQLA